MPFLVVRGTFHLVGQNVNGNPTGFQPDGDSIHFKPLVASHLDELEQPGNPYRLTRIGSVNLRFEGIDAPELHYQGTRQPAPLAEQARDFLTGQIGMNPVTYGPSGTTVKPPANDGQQGFILSRSLEFHGRPVSFVFLGTNPPKPDGQQAFLDAQLLRQSLNHQLILQGHAYPLFYDTLFSDLRAELTTAANQARQAGRGVWVSDPTVFAPVDDLNDIETQHTVYPKLFRRLSDYVRDGNTGVADLPEYLVLVDVVVALSTNPLQELGIVGDG
jgi:endonuclease YncB( thermonuclease family)